MKPVLSAAVALFAAAAAFAVEAPPAPAEPAKAAYPLDTCVVTGEKLGSMGDPYIHQHEGREVRFCCKGCVKAFKRDPAAHLAKIDAAAKAAPTAPVPAPAAAQP